MVSEYAPARRADVPPWRRAAALEHLDANPTTLVSI
jgi:hypothetical protein